MIPRSARVREPASGFPAALSTGTGCLGPPEHGSVRGQLALAAGYLLAGGACTLAALAIPPVWAIVTAGPAQQVRLIGAHQIAWMLGLWLWAISAGLTMPGMLALGSALGRAPNAASLGVSNADAALRAAGGLFAVGTALWLSNLAFGATAAVTAADAVRAGGTIPDWFPAVQQWASGLWLVGAPMLGLSLVLYGLLIRRAAMLPSWGGWLALAAGTLVLISAAVLRGTPPFLIYLLATLPLGIAAALRAGARTKI